LRSSHCPIVDQALDYGIDAILAGLERQPG
jgi:hypothetical protein